MHAVFFTMVLLRLQKLVDKQAESFSKTNPVPRIFCSFCYSVPVQSLIFTFLRSLSERESKGEILESFDMKKELDPLHWSQTLPLLIPTLSPPLMLHCNKFSTNHTVCRTGPATAGRLKRTIY